MYIVYNLNKVDSNNEEQFCFIIYALEIRGTSRGEGDGVEERGRSLGDRDKPVT